MIEVEMKYGFPLFSKRGTIVSLGKNEKLVISDIWAFWDYVVKKAAKDGKTKLYLGSLLEQAKHFYITAEQSPTKSQPLLYYYSFLNFAKILINLTGGHGHTKTYMHGLSEKHNNKFSHSTIKKQVIKTSVVQVAHELVSTFDKNISTLEVTIRVKELLNHCVGVHRAYAEIYSQREIFHKIKEQKLYKNGKELIFKAELQCSVNDIANLQHQGYQIFKEEETIFYIEKITMSSYSPTRKDYADLSEKIQNNGIWYFIGNAGYTTYLSNSSIGRYSQESVIYMTIESPPVL